MHHPILYNRFVEQMVSTLHLAEGSPVSFKLVQDLTKWDTNRVRWTPKQALAYHDHESSKRGGLLWLLPQWWSPRVGHDPGEGGAGVTGRPACVNPANPQRGDSEAGPGPARVPPSPGDATPPLASPSAPRGGAGGGGRARGREWQAAGQAARAQSAPLWSPAGGWRSGRR